MGWERLNRFHWFLLVSAVLIATVVVMAGLVVGRFFERNALAHEQEDTARIVETQTRQHLTPADFTLPRSRGGEVFESFLLELPEVFRIKVFDSTGRIVWSDEPRLVGMAFPDNPYLARALNGEVVTVLEEPKRAEHLYERTKGYVAEAYVPIRFPGSPSVIGVIETYKDLTAFLLGIRRTQRLIWGFTGGMGLFLYLALAFVVWRASINEQRALRRLEAQNREVREAHERLAAILAGVADRMMIVDREMRIVWMNAASAEALGPAEGALGLPCFRVLGGEPEACQSCPAVRTFLSGMVGRGVRAQRLPTGEVRYLDLVTAPLRDASGQVHQVLEVARDITELVEMEERLKQSAARLEESHASLLGKADELERANRALQDAQAQLVEKERLAAVGELVVGLHHAILNPLTGILGVLQLLRPEGTIRPETAEALVEAEAEIRRIEQLIRGLPALRRATGAPYVGDTKMLDLEHSEPEDKRA